MTVTAQDLTRLNRDVIGEIREMHPLLTPKLTNATIKRVVKDYLTGGARKQRIVQKYGDISQWDVSNVTNIKLLFWNQSSFNQPLNGWNVSNVTDMKWMFENASSFNQSLNDWNVSNVEDMWGMFLSATSFNQPLNKWNVSNVENMYGMFADAASLDGKSQNRND